MAKINYQDRVVHLNDLDIPLRVYFEARMSVRVSLGKDFVIMRMPNFYKSDLEKHVLFAENWLQKLKRDKPEVLERYSISKYESEYTLTIMGKYQHKVKIQSSSRSNSIATLEDDRSISIVIPNTLTSFQKKKIVRTITSKILAKIYKSLVVDKIAYWNVMKFGNKPIKTVSLKYNSTNWGSCSTKGQINISTRSLLLPEASFDYLIIHELSHMVEMNHSSRFWAVVKEAMPDYEKHETWISTHGKKLDF